MCKSGIGTSKDFVLDVTCISRDDNRKGGGFIIIDFAVSKRCPNIALQNSTPWEPEDKNLVMLQHC
jgi:hypothetical protein